MDSNDWGYLLTLGPTRTDTGSNEATNRCPEEQDRLSEVIIFNSMQCKEVLLIINNGVQMFVYTGIRSSRNVTFNFKMTQLIK